jgi:hypothetical protein
MRLVKTSHHAEAQQLVVDDAVDLAGVGGAGESPPALSARGAALADPLPLLPIPPFNNGEDAILTGVLGKFAEISGAGEDNGET